jgi:hypothetical protein
VKARLDPDLLQLGGNDKAMNRGRNYDGRQYVTNAIEAHHRLL